MSEKLMTKFLGKQLNSPLVLPAGIMDMSYSGLLLMDKMGAGMVTSKSLTLESRVGHKGPVVAEFEGGILNCMGLCNPGIEEGLREIDDFKKRSDTPVIVSVFATNSKDFTELANQVNLSKAEFLELNLSCPNVFDEFGIPLSASATQVFEIVNSVKQISHKPLIAKLSPNVVNIVEIAESAVNAGADALCLINTLGPGMLIDIRLKKPVLFNRFGGVSGPCLKPIALKLIYEVFSIIEVPIIGMGGVVRGDDVIEMLMAGATVVGIGTGIYYRGTEIFRKINSELLAFLREENYSSIQDLPKLGKM